MRVHTGGMADVVRNIIIALSCKLFWKRYTIRNHWLIVNIDSTPTALPVPDDVSSRRPDTR